MLTKQNTKQKVYKHVMFIKQKVYLQGMFTKQKFLNTLCLHNKNVQTSYVYKTKQYKTESLQTRYIYKTKIYRQVMLTKHYKTNKCLQNKSFTNTLCLQNKMKMYRQVMFTKQKFTNTVF